MNQKQFTQIAHADLKSAGLSSSLPQSLKIVSTVLNAFRNEIAKGKSITISDFGTFSTRNVSRRNMSDPDAPRIKNWEVKFKAATKLKKQLNEN